MKPLYLAVLTLILASVVSYATTKAVQSTAPSPSVSPVIEQQSKAQESAFDRVLKTNTLRCAYASADPYILKDSNTDEIKGPVAEIAQALALSLNLKVEWVAEVGYADFAEGLKTGRYDAFCGILSMAAPRARVSAFTSPLFYTHYYIFTRQDEKRFSTLSDANRSEIKAGVIDGEVFQRMTAKHLPKATEHTLTNMSSPGQLYVDIAEGKADVVIHDPTAVAHYNAANPDKALKKILDKPLEISSFAFVVAPKEFALLNMLNTGILSLHNSGKIDNIFTRHHMDSSTIYRISKPYEVTK